MALTMRWWVLWSAMLLLAGCSELQPLGEPNLLLRDKARLGPEGGNLRVHGGQLSIPAEVLENEQVIELSRAPSEPVDTLWGGVGLVPASDVFHITPAELVSLESEFNLTLTLNGGEEGLADALLFTTEGCGQWMFATFLTTSVTRQQSTYTVSLFTLGTFMAAQLNPALGEEVFEAIFATYPEEVPLCVVDEDCDYLCPFDDEACGAFCNVLGECDRVSACTCAREQTCDPTACRVPDSLPEACHVTFDALAKTLVEFEREEDASQDDDLEDAQSSRPEEDP
ncbi:MAG: hypothetical protein AAFX99_17140 [Myxococcota bacterium]